MKKLFLILTLLASYASIYAEAEAYKTAATLERGKVYTAKVYDKGNTITITKVNELNDTENTGSPSAESNNSKVALGCSNIFGC